MNTTSLSFDGTITFKSNSFFDVMSTQQIHRCKIAPQLEKEFSRNKHQVTMNLKEIQWLAIGDFVRVVTLDGIIWQITQVYPRKSLLYRRAASPNAFRLKEAQVIAANVDQLMAVIAITQPEIKWNLLDRYLVQAEACGLKALICFTKYDFLTLYRKVFSRNFLHRSKIIVIWVTRLYKRVV